MKLKSIALLALVSVSSLTNAQSWLDLTDTYIVNPNFDDNSSIGWTYTSNARSQTINHGTMEFWYGAFHIHQTTDIPNGKYRLSVNAFYRFTNNVSGYTAHKKGTEKLTAYLYANDSTATVASIFSDPSKELITGSWKTQDSNNNTVYFPSTMSSAAVYFERGKYLNTLEFEVTDNTLTFGIINEKSSIDNWCMFDNFRLEYYGEEVPITEISFPSEGLTLVKGETRRFTPVIVPENATYRSFSWSSSNPEVATVDNYGNITAINEGETVIRAISKRYNVEAKCTLTVSKNTEGQALLLINEIQSCNIDMFVDPSYNYGGWFELYNPTDNTVSLDGLYISDDPLNLQKFRIYGSEIIPSKTFKTIWFDHNNVNPNQVNFKLDYDGGTIYLSNQDGEILISQIYPVGVPRTSYARTTDGGLSWGTTSTPTPGISNEGSTFAASRLDAPVVDKDAQLFKSPLTINVSIPEGAKLRYTTDGSTPTLTNGKTSRTGMFTVSATTTYRFRLFKDGMLPSQVVTRSYIYKDKEYKFPIISVVTDEVNLYDDTLGVYVRGVNGRPGNGQSNPCNWNMDWDRPVNFEYITPEGEMAINQEVDFAMCGGWSRAWTPHSFKLKAGKIYEGKNFYDHPLFDSKPHLKHKTLQIRNGGNDSGSRIKDAALQEIVRTSGLDVDGQAYQPIHNFINGEYIGMLNMREPNNKHFVYANYGYDSEEIDQFEMSPDSGYCQMTGTKDSFLKWKELSFNAADPATYEEICDMVDIDEYINYLAVEFYLGAADWPQNNVKGFRPRHDGGKFRFVLFDLDGTFGTSDPFNTFEWKQTYTFDQLYPSSLGRITEEIEFVTIFLNMLQNDTFKKKFIDSYCLVAGSVFTPQRCDSIINAMAANTNSVLQWEGQSPYNTANSLKNSLANRQFAMINTMKQYERFNISSEAELTVTLNADNADARLMVNDMQVPTNKFDGSLFSPITLKAEAPAGYRFCGWRNNGAPPMTTTDANQYISSEPEFELPKSGSYSLTACFEPLTDEEREEAGTTPIKVNELSAANSVYINDHYKKNDWIELYNTTDSAINIAGMYVSDNLNKPMKWQVPSSDVGVRTVIEPHGHLIIWADKLDPISQLHSSFKLAEEGGLVVIMAEDLSWYDTFCYSTHNGTQSVGLYPDGGNTIYVMNKPTLAASNVINSYATIYEEPDISQEPVIPAGIHDTEIGNNGGLSLTYSDATVTVHSENTGRVRYLVSTIAGQTCMEGTLNVSGTETISLNSLPDGTYIVRVSDSDNNHRTIKVLK